MLQYFRRDHPVKYFIAKRHRRGVSAHRARVGSGRDLPAGQHGHGHAGDLAQFAVVSVESYDVTAAPVYLECVPPAAAAKIEHTITRPDGEMAEVHGQQCPAPFSEVWWRVAAGRGDPLRRSRGGIPRPPRGQPRTR